MRDIPRKMGKPICMQDRPKNLIILCADEMRGDCLGANQLNGDIQTPHMDALADRGVNLMRHFTTFPKCVPARVSMMTGRYCHTDGFRTIFEHLPADRPNLLKSVLDHGYQTAVFGLNHAWEHMLEASHTRPNSRQDNKGYGSITTLGLADSATYTIGIGIRRPIKRLCAILLNWIAH